MSNSSIVCLTTSLVLVIVGGGVTVCVFDIMALTEVSSKTVQNTCEGSRLWLYLFLSMVLSGLMSYSRKNKEEDDDDDEEEILKSKVTKWTILYVVTELIFLFFTYLLLRIVQDFSSSFLIT